MKQVFRTIVFGIVVAALWGGCGLQIKPLKATLGDMSGTSVAAGNDNVVFRFFDEDFVSGGMRTGIPMSPRCLFPKSQGKMAKLHYSLI